MTYDFTGNLLKDSEMLYNLRKSNTRKRYIIINLSDTNLQTFATCKTEIILLLTWCINRIQIHYLKEQNDKLTKENNEYRETANVQQRVIFDLKQDLGILDQRNYDLESRFCSNQKMLKDLKSENQTLQQQNENYKSVKEQLYAKGQQIKRFYESKLAQFQTEFDELRERDERNASYNHF